MNLAVGLLNLLSLRHLIIVSKVKAICTLWNLIFNINDIFKLLLLIKVQTPRLLAKQLFGKVVALCQPRNVVSLQLCLPIDLLDSLLIQIQNRQLHDVSLVKDIAALEILLVALGLRRRHSVEPDLPLALDVILRFRYHFLIVVPEVRAHCIDLGVQITRQVLLEKLKASLAV